LSAKVTPLGSAPVSVSAGEGDPVVVTKNNSTEPTSNVVLLALVKTGDVPPPPLVTVSVNVCDAAVPTPFPAVIVKEYVPAVPAAGVPLSVPNPLPLPSPLSANVTPLGSAPVSLRFAAGVPVVETVNVPATPTEKVVLLALVIAGAWSTVSVKACEAGVPTPLLAVKVSGYVPPVPAAGVPINVPVPFALATNVTPLGRTPASVMEGAGVPVVVTVKFPAPPTVNVVLFALVIVGAVCAVFTIKAKF
jgi:hypothetical protein